VTFSPASLLLNPGSGEQFVVTFDSSSGAVGEGDNQGFLVLTSGDYEVSMPLWARVLAPTPNTVLLLNAEGLSGATTPALTAYTSTLDALGIKYDTQDAMTLVQSDLYWMSAYPMIFFFTGSNAAKSGGAVTILGDESVEVLREYVAMGGRVFLSGAFAPLAFIFNNVDLSGFTPVPLTRSLTGAYIPTGPFQGWPSAPSAFQGLSYTLSAQVYASRYVAEVSSDEVPGQIVPLLYYPPTPGRSIQDQGVVCVGIRAQPSLLFPGPSFPFATVTSSIGLEMLAAVQDRKTYASAVVAFLTEQLQLNVSVVPALANDTTTGDRFQLNLTSTLTGSTAANLSLPSIAPSFSVSFGSGEPGLTAEATSAMTGSTLEMTLDHCFATTGEHAVSVSAVSPFGTVAIWSGTVNASYCEPTVSAASSARSPLAALLSQL